MMAMTGMQVPSVEVDSGWGRSRAPSTIVASTGGALVAEAALHLVDVGVDDPLNGTAVASARQTSTFLTTLDLSCI